MLEDASGDSQGVDEPELVAAECGRIVVEAAAMMMVGTIGGVEVMQISQKCAECLMRALLIL